MKCFHHYLQGPKFRIGTDHAPLHTVLKVWEPSWTREYLYEQQREDINFKVHQFMEASASRPKWEDVSPYERTLKALWAQWDQLEFRDQVLCRR